MMTAQSLLIEDKYIRRMRAAPRLAGWGRTNKPKVTCKPKQRQEGTTRRRNSSRGKLGESGDQFGGNSQLSTADFCKLVKRRFKKNPDIYLRFQQVLSRLDSAGSLEIVKELITLFDGHSDLILHMNNFIPDQYLIEVQDDAVVVKVFCSSKPDPAIETGHGRTIPATDGPQLPSSKSLSYIINAKKVFAKEPHVYNRFMEILKNYHGGKLGDLETINRVIALFKAYPDLVLGFNEFLPKGYLIHMYDRSEYVVEFPGKHGTRDKVKIKI